MLNLSHNEFMAVTAFTTLQIPRCPSQFGMKSKTGAGATHAKSLLERNAADAAH